MPKPNFYLMSGEDHFSLLEEAKRWKTAFIEKFGDTDVEELDGENVDAEEIGRAVRSLPFLSEKRLVLLKNFLSTQKAEVTNGLLPVLEQIPDSTFFVMLETEPDKRTGIFKAITQTATQRLFLKPKGAQLNTWVLRRAESLGSRLSPDTAAYLISWVGDDLYALWNEIQKLALYAKNDAITPTMIDLLVTDSVQKSIFTLTDELSKKNLPAALRIVQSLQDQGEEASYLFAMLARQFRLLLEVKALAKENQSPSQIARIMAVHPFVVENTLRFSKNFTENELRKALAKLLELDKRLKTGLIPLKPRDEDHFLLQLEKIILA